MSTSQWANIEDDAGALHALVAALAEQVPVPLIDFLWIFPARKVAVGESVVIVIAAYDADQERRRVMTAHYTVSRNRKGAATVSTRFDEHGSAPHDAVPRIVQGVLRRLGEDMTAEPREELIAGEPGAWNALIVDLGGRPADESADVAADPETDTGADAQAQPGEARAPADEPSSA